MSHDYDHIFKENIHEILPGLCKQHLEIDIVTSKSIKDKIQVTIEREADFLQKVTTTAGEEMIIHLEFQTADDKTMIDRMHFYWLLLRQKYKMEIRQYVVYIGHKKPTMLTQLLPEKQYTGFQLIDVGSLSYKESLVSVVPAEVIMGVLNNMADAEVESVLKKIILRLQKLTNSEQAFNKYLKQLLVFARIKKVTTIIDKLLQDMDITYDIKEDAFYQKGIKQGKAEGRMEGKAEGRMEGRMEGKAEGRMEGKAEGKMEGKVEIALQMKKRGDSLQSIQEVTGLSIKEIKKLKP